MDYVLQARPDSPRARVTRWVRPDAPAWLLPGSGVLAAGFLIFTLLTLAGPPITGIDQWFFDLHLVRHDSAWHEILTVWVVLGQRAVAMAIVGGYAIHRARRTHSAYPLALFAAGSALFIGTVVVLKYGTGRIGPRFIDIAHTVWDGGNIYPSGHVAGTVVLYGVMVMLAPAVHRRHFLLGAAALALTIGASTIALNTHWFSDVIGAYLLGMLVLMATWTVAPTVAARIEPEVRRFAPVLLGSVATHRRRRAARGSVLGA